MVDCYPVAAVRHFRDAVLLHNSLRYDNAMCHYAFSAECAVKAFLQQFHLPICKHHDAMEEIADHMQTYHELFGFLNPNLYPLIGVEAPPPELFADHPARRFGKDRAYTSQQLNDSKHFVEILVNHLVSAALDDRIKY